MKRRNFFSTLLGAAAASKAAPPPDPNRILSNEPTVICIEGLLFEQPPLDTTYRVFTFSRGIVHLEELK